MKNVKNTLLILFITLGLVSCDEDLLIFSNDNFVQLNSVAATSVVENSGNSVDVTALLASPQSTPTTVNFDISGTAEASRFILSPGSSVIIPAGETSATVVLTPVDNDEIDGDVEVIIALSTSTDVPIGIGGEGLQSISRTITIVDDNVPCNAYSFTIVVDRWGTEAMWDVLDSNGNVVSSGGPFVDTGAGTFTDVSVNLNLPDGCYTFRVFDWWGDGWSDGGGASYVVQCGALVQGMGDGNFSGIPNLDINTVPVNPVYGSKFRAGSATSGVAPFTNHAEQIEFCVNQ